MRNLGRVVVASRYSTRVTKFGIKLPFSPCEKWSKSHTYIGEVGQIFSSESDQHRQRITLSQDT